MKAKDKIVFEPIGVAHTPFKEQAGTPIQPKAGKGVQGKIEILQELTEGLADLDGFSHIIVLFHLHLSDGYKLKVVPYMDEQERGVFATRAPRRPNPIGLSVVRLQRVEDNVLHICDVDMLDGTPVLDIKPYTPHFEPDEEFKSGWLQQVGRTVSSRCADERFKSSKPEEININHKELKERKETS